MADDYEWRGSSGDFGTAGNWDNFTTGTSPADSPPGPSDSATLHTDDPANTVSGNGDVDMLQIADNIAITGALTAETGISFFPVFETSSSTLDGGTLYGKQSISIDPGTFDVTDGGLLRTGGALLDYGTLSISSGTIDATAAVGIGGALRLTDGQITTNGVAVGSNPGVASTLDIGSGGTVSGTYGEIGMTSGDRSSVTVHNGGSWQSSNNIIVGLGSVGMLAITAGGRVSALGSGQTSGTAPLTLGLGAGTGGVLTVDGAGSVLDVSGDADIGFFSGPARVTLSAAGSLDVTGTLNAGTADIDVDGGSLSIGQGMTMTEVASTLEIEGGGSVTGPVSPNHMTIQGSIDVNDGQFTGAYLAAGGTITVQDGTIACNSILLGGGTGGVLQTTTLESGGLLNSAITELGPESGDKAIVYLHAGSTLQSSFQLMVGAGGSGGLDIEGGLANVEGGITEGNAAFDAGELNAAALGTVALDGTGSSLRVTGAAVLGDAGSGSLLLGTNSSFTVSFGLYEGAQASGGGILQVVDRTDTFTVGGDWVIGDAGRHFDTIEGGASATVGGALTIARGGGAGALSVSDSDSKISVAGAVTVGQSGSGTLQIEAGASLSAGDVFAVSSGSADIGSGAQVSATSATIGAAGSLSIAGGTLAAIGAVAVGGSVSGYGTIAAGSFADAGAVTASGGALVVQGSVTGTGMLTISAATLELQAGIAAGPTISFAGGSLLLDAPGADGPQMAGFAAGDTIVLNGVIANAGTFAGGTLTLDDGGAPQATLAFSGGYDSDNFAVAAVGGQTTVTFVACFAADTRIATPDGPVAVQDLREGDRVLRAFGGTARVAWLGHRRIACRRHPRPQDVQPVRVRAGAFGPGRPGRDLRLSPDHAVHLGAGRAPGALIPVRYLINGATIVQEPAEHVTYWHVELARHDVILAEGLPCESYLDTGNRGAFANGGAGTHLHADFALRVWDAKGCARLVRDGAELLAARRACLARARALGHVLTEDADLHLLADGEVLRPIAVDGPRHRFELRGNAATLRLRSRGGVPAHVDPAGADHRRLGVMITRIAAFRPWQWHEIGFADIQDGMGFHAPEQAGGRSWRWTDGDAGVPLPPDCARDGVLLLDVDVAAVQPAWRAAPESVARQFGGREAGDRERR